MWWNIKYALMYMKRGFELGLYSMHELPFIFAYMEVLYNSGVNQRNFMVAGLIEGATENIFETPGLNKKRKKLNKMQRLYFDELVYFQGMALFSKAMYTMVLGCIKEGIVKNYFAEQFQEEAAYLKRFQIFQNMLYPSFMDYEKYQDLVKPLSEKKHAELYEMSKDLFMQAKNKLNSLLTTETAARNVDHYPNELLEGVIKICVGNSLVPLRAQMMKGKCKLEIAAKIPVAPSIEVSSRP